MTDSKTSWLARGSAIAIMMAAGIALAACGGDNGLSQSEEDELQEMLEAAEAEAAAEKAAKEEAEAAAAAEKAAKEKAEAEAAVEKAARETAEAEKAKAEADAAAADAARKASEAAAEASAAVAKQAAEDAAEAAEAAKQAAADLVEAQAKQEEAEDALAIAVADEAEAERRRQAAAAAAAAAQQRERDAEEARRQAEEEAEELREDAESLIQRVDARNALDGLRAAVRITGLASVSGLTHTGPAASVAVIPRHGATASVTPNPSWGFSSSQRSSSGGWSVTTLSNLGFTHNDELVVYSNRRGQTSVPLTQEYAGSSPARFQDGDSANAGTRISGGITDADRLLISSGSFPSVDGTDKTYPGTHDSDPTTDASDDGNPSTTWDGDGIAGNDRDLARIGGSFQGATGNFECSPGVQACTIGRRGDSYTVSAGWTFVTTDRATARIDDRSYAYFGWWRREQKSNETFSYLPFADIAPNATTGGNQTLTYTATAGGGSNFNALTGSATYRGPAVGQYAIYQPLGGQSGTGAFTAQATLTANFDANNLSGTVTNFSNDSSWALTLNSASMAGGDVASADAGSVVDWTIAGNTSDVQGDWEAEFYSETNYVGQFPDGVVGTFTAAYDADIDGDADLDEIVGAIIGAFGATK